MMRTFIQMGIDLMTDPVNSLPALIDGIIANMHAFADIEADDRAGYARQDIKHWTELELKLLRRRYAHNQIGDFHVELRELSHVFVDYFRIYRKFFEAEAFTRIIWRH